jgi:hypothetical protein
LPVVAVADAGALVATGRVPSFHVVFTGIRVGDVVVPPIGAYFWEDELVLDDRMGEDWTPAALAAFARLLGEMRAHAPGVELQARPDGGGPEHADPRFPPAIDAYLAGTAGG